VLSRLGGSVAATPSTLAGKLAFIIVRWEEVAALLVSTQIDSSPGNLVLLAFKLHGEKWILS
jgi:hypothetical protein